MAARIAADLPTTSRQAIDAVASALRRHGLVVDDGDTIAPTTAGEAKSAFVVRRPDGALFVKRTFPHWWQIEATLQRLVAERCPGLALPVLHELPEVHAFAMPHLAPEDARAWADVEPAADAAAAAVGSRLGELHRLTAGDADIAAAADANRMRMVEVRSAFLRLCVSFRPTLADIVYRTIAETFACRQALAHGDADPANVIIGRDRIVLVDFEKAWFGDPAFDAGWMLAGLVHRAQRRPDGPARQALPDRLRRAAAGWLAQVDWEPRERAEARAVRIALMRIVARHQDLAERSRRPPPAWLVAEIEHLADLLARGEADVNALVDAVGPTAPK